VTLPAAIRLPWAFPADELAREVLALDEGDWASHFNTGIYEGGWDAATLRAPVGGVGAVLPGYPDPTATGFADTDLLARCPAAARVLAAIPATLLSARFLRLASGAEIREHRDHLLGHAHGEVRLHVGVTTSAGAELVVDGRVVPIEPGGCWYIDASRPHRARNPGAGSRIHLVVDAVVGPALDDVLRRSAVLHPNG
jgi:mannose-6-phosphate isomerase-like protein (cupin superfamily)